eukprot:2714417-Rhodomonas_salina.2
MPPMTQQRGATCVGCATVQQKRVERPRREARTMYCFDNDSMNSKRLRCSNPRCQQPQVGNVRRAR